MPTHLTVLICTHNRAELLQQAVVSLQACTRPLNLQVNILVVANACDDGSHAVLEGLANGAGAQRFPVQWVAEPTAGKSHALNKGISLLRGDWVAVVDDDHRVSNDFLVAIEKAIADYPEATMLCGRVLPDWDGREPSWVHDQGPYRIYPLPIPRQDFGGAPRELGANGPTPGGGNQIFRVDLLRRIGPFSTELGPQGHDLGGGEDTEYVLRALHLGERLWYVPQIVQYHHVDLARLTLPYLMRKAYQRSASAVRLQALHVPPPARQVGVPLYLYRKLLGYAAGALFSLGMARRRFYLVRSAAALGEVAGLRRCRQHALSATTARTRSDHA